MASRRLITEALVRNAHASGERTVRLGRDDIITPLARDTARRLGVELLNERDAKESNPARIPGTTISDAARIVAIGSDHGGFSYKNVIVPFVADMGWTVLDVGTDSEQSCDYPDFAYAVAHLVSVGEARFGVMIDGAGIGSAMVCNKVPSVRAACPYNEFTAWNARAHNDANVLTLGSRTLGIEVCKSIVRVFLSEPFEGGRHQKRVAKIAGVEERFTRRS